MNAFGLLVLLSFVSAAFWLAATRPHQALAAAVFLLPWGGLYVDVGLWITAYQIVIFALCVMTFLRSIYSDWRPPAVVHAGFLAAFLLFAILASLVQMGAIPATAINASSGALRGPAARAIIQLFMFSFTISPALLVPFIMRRPEQVAALCTTYIKSAVIVGMLGWLQLVIWIAIGQNPMPIGFVNHALGGASPFVSNGVISFGSLYVPRMNSFSGEPRALGGAMVFAMMLIQAIAATTVTNQRRKLFGIWLFLAITTLATLSTSSLLLWTLGSAVQVPMALLFGVKTRISLGRLLSVLSAFVLTLTLIVSAIESTGFPLIALAQSRTIDRLDVSGAVEDFDLAILDYFRANPERSIAGLGLGNAHLYAMRYIDPAFQWYALGGVFTAKSNYLRIISEIGFIGLFLLLGWITSLMISASRAVRSHWLAGLAAIVPVAASTATVFLASGYNGEFYIVAGTLAAVAGMRRPVPRVATGVAAPA